MPTVIGINQVPAPPIRPNIWDWYGQYTGHAMDVLLKALVGQMGSGGGIGQVPTTPTPNNPGSLNFPSGGMQQAGYDPSQIGPYGGPSTPQTARTSMGVNIPAEAISGYGQSGGVQFIQPTKWGVKPNLDYLVKQAELDKARRDLDPNSPDNLYKRSQEELNNSISAYNRKMMSGMDDLPPPPPSPFDGISSLRSIADKADAGDETAQAVMEYILKHGLQ